MIGHERTKKISASQKIRRSKRPIITNMIEAKTHYGMGIDVKDLL